MQTIEAVVNRILQDREKSAANITVASADDVPINQTESAQIIENINSAEIMDSLGENGLNAIAGALDMFRKK